MFSVLQAAVVSTSKVIYVCTQTVGASAACGSHACYHLEGLPLQ